MGRTSSFLRTCTLGSGAPNLAMARLMAAATTASVGCPGAAVAPGLPLLAADEASEERPILFAWAFAEMRARSDEGGSFGSLLVLMDRLRVSPFVPLLGPWPDGVELPSGAPLPPPLAAPFEGNSVWMKQHLRESISGFAPSDPVRKRTNLLPYGHDPDTQNVRQISVLY